MSEEPMSGATPTGISRRRMLKRIGTGVAVAWTVPVITSIETPRFCRFPRDLRLHHRAVRHRELRTARSGLFVRDVGFAWLRLLHPDLLEPVLERLGLWARSPVRRGVLRPEHLRRYLQRCACSEPPCSRLVQGLRN